MVKNAAFWMSSLFFLVLDQSTKYAIVHNMGISESFPLWQGVFHITFITNSGAAFSFFSRSGDWLKWVSFLVSLGLVTLGYFSKLDRWEQIGYGCILGGALGNGIDRFVNGYVVDFLDFRLINFAVFNVADVSINIGLLCLLITWFRTSKPKPNR